MAIVPLRTRTSGNVDVDDLQDAVDDVLRDVSSRRILDGFLLEGVELDSSGWTQVAHGLGRPAKYIVVSRDAAATVYDDSAGNEALNDKLLKLRADAAVTVDIWVF